MGSVKTKTVELVDMCCGSCGIDFCVPDWFYRDCLQNGRTFHCPDGHPRIFTKPEVEKLRERVARLEANIVHLEDQRRAAERSAAAFKGQVTQLRNRVVNGVCPCCHRSFVNVARHMATKHPSYAAEEATS